LQQGRASRNAHPLSLRQQQKVNSKEELVISDNLLALLPKKVTYLHSLDQDHIRILLSLNESYHKVTQIRTKLKIEPEKN
jgi:hypothetical protein